MSREISPKILQEYRSFSPFFFPPPRPILGTLVFMGTFGLSAVGVDKEEKKREDYFMGTSPILSIFSSLSLSSYDDPSCLPHS